MHDHRTHITSAIGKDLCARSKKKVTYGGKEFIMDLKGRQLIIFKREELYTENLSNSFSNFVNLS